MPMLTMIGNSQAFVQKSSASAKKFYSIVTFQFSAMVDLGYFSGNNNSSSKAKGRRLNDLWSIAEELFWKVQV